MPVNPKAISGTFVFPNGTPAAGATLKLTLSQSAVLDDNSGSVAPMTYNVVLDSSGSVPSGSDVYFNDTLLPTGTFYTWVIDSPSFGKVFGPVQAQILGTAPFNLNT